MKEPIESNKYKSMLNKLSYMIVWKRAYIVAFFIALCLSLFIKGNIDGMKEFFIYFIISYVGIVTMLNWNQAHTVEPINRLIDQHISRQDKIIDDLKTTSSKEIKPVKIIRKLEVNLGDRLARPNSSKTSTI